MAPEAHMRCAPSPTDVRACVCSCDGSPLEIKKLTGEEPVETIDFTGKRLKVGSAVVIVNLISSNTVTTSLK